MREIVDEVRHARIVDVVAQATDVELGEVPWLFRSSFYSAATATGSRMRVRRVVVDAPLDLVPEMAEQALHRPGRAVAEGADGVALDLGGDLAAACRSRASARGLPPCA